MEAALLYLVTLLLESCSLLRISIALNLFYVDSDEFVLLTHGLSIDKIDSVMV